MPVDASIYSAFAPKVRSVEDYQNAIAQQEQNALAAEAARIGIQEKRQALADAPLMRQRALEEHQAKLGKLQADAKLAESHAGEFDASAALKKLQARRDGIAYLAQKARQLNTDEDIANWYKEGVDVGVIKPDDVMAKIQQVPPPGPEREKWKLDQFRNGMGAAEQAHQELTAAAQAETQRRNRATEAQAAAALKEQERTHKAHEGIAGAHLGLAREAAARAANAPKGQIVQTDQGPMLVDPRDPSSATPITTKDGAAIKAPGPKMKDIPNQVVSGYINNQAALKKIDDAIAAVKSNGDAVGMKNYAPDAIVQRVDPNGVKTRAIISDIGSLKIHDRTGAAMSAAESQRLNPFIPKATDSRETILHKLEQMKAEYADKNSGMETYYNSDMGFKPITDISVPRSPAAGGLPPEIDAILKKHGAKK